MKKPLIGKLSELNKFMKTYKLFYGRLFFLSKKLINNWVKLST